MRWVGTEERTQEGRTSLAQMSVMAQPPLEWSPKVWTT